MGLKGAEIDAHAYEVVSSQKVPGNLHDLNYSHFRHDTTRH